MVFFFKQKTAYEMRISDWSSDVCSSDLDRGVTYARKLPDGSTLVAGDWWPENYDGPPLISLEERAARGLGLWVGDTLTINEIGRASCRERVCQYVSISVVAVSLQTKNNNAHKRSHHTTRTHLKNT